MLSLKATTARTFAARQAPKAAARRSVAAKAKYGDESIYFDLNDLENTVGSWDIYGTDDKKRYPELQNDFFNRAAGPLSRRESLLAFATIGGTGALLVWGAKGSKDAKLPITLGPQKPAQVGPRGRI